MSALKTDWTDYEDSLRYFTAIQKGASCIVTHNKKDFEKALIPIYTPEEFLAQIKAYAARLAKKYQTSADDYVYEPNEETKDAIREAKAHIAAIKCGKVNPDEGAIDTSSVEAMLKSCGL